MAYQGFDNSVSFGLGVSNHGVSFGVSYTDYDGYYDDYYDDYYGYDSYYGSCWDYSWYDPFFDCGWSSYGYYSTIAWRPWRLYDPWWGPSFYFTGWPSHRYIRHSYYRYAWASPYRYQYGYWGYYGTPRLARLYTDYGRSYQYGRAYPRGYVSRDGYRGARRSPMFGPRYKESPRVLVTDNGPERRTSRAVPRGEAGSALSPGRVTTSRRPDVGSGTRQARPRSGVVETERPRIRTRDDNARTPSAPAGRVRSGSDRGRDDGRVTRPPAGPRTPPSARTRGNAVDEARTRTTRPSTRSTPGQATRQPSARSGGTESRGTPANVRPRTRSSAPATRSSPPRVRPRGGSAAPTSKPQAAPRTRSRPGGQPGVRSSAPTNRSGVRARGGSGRAPEARSAPPRPAPQARSGGSRPAPRARSGGSARPAPKARAGGSSRPAPKARTGGSSRPAPKARAGGNRRSGGSAARRRGGD